MRSGYADGVVLEKGDTVAAGKLDHAGGTAETEVNAGKELNVTQLAAEPNATCSGPSSVRGTSERLPETALPTEAITVGAKRRWSELPSTGAPLIILDDSQQRTELED